MTVRTATARVSLVAHRFAGHHLTGIGRYYTEVSLALARHADGMTFELWSPREPAPPDWLADGMRYGTIAGHREALLLSWCIAGRPFLDDRLGNPDLVHVLHPWVATPTRAPLVTTVHDLMPMLQPHWYPRKERWTFRRGVHHVRDHAAKVVSVSSFVADLMTEHAGIERDRIVVVPEGVGAEWSSARDPADPELTPSRYGVREGRYLITVGTVSVRKNLFPVLRALARLEPLDPGRPDLVVAGPPGRDADVIHAEVARLGIGERINFAGFVPDADLPALVAGALALVHPSRDEGFGLTPLEAMAAGTATLSSNCGSLPEVVGDAGLLIDPDDADRWAEAIAAVRDDGDRRAALVTAGLARAAEYTWDHTAEGLRHVYRDVLRAP